MWVVLCAAAGGTAATSGWLEERQIDVAVLKRVAEGDADALAELYDRHARSLYALALRILGDQSDAEDVVQEVFAQAWAQAGRYDAKRGVVAAWLLTIGRSRSIDRLRARRTREGRTSVMGDSLPDVAAPGHMPDVLLVSSEQVQRVRTALHELPAVQRIVLELAYYEGLTHSEIAERLEQPLGTVKTRIRVALGKLRAALTGAI